MDSVIRYLGWGLWRFYQRCINISIKAITDGMLATAKECAALDISLSTLTNLHISGNIGYIEPFKESSYSFRSFIYSYIYVKKHIQL